MLHILKKWRDEHPFVNYFEVHSASYPSIGDRTVSQVRCHAASLRATCRILQAKTLKQVPYPKLAPMIPTVTLYILFTVLFFSFCDSLRQHSNTAQSLWATLSREAAKIGDMTLETGTAPWHTTPINRVMICFGKESLHFWAQSGGSTCRAPPLPVWGLNFCGS